MIDLTGADGRMAWQAAVESITVPGVGAEEEEEDDDEFIFPANHSTDGIQSGGLEPRPCRNTMADLKGDRDRVAEEALIIILLD